MIKKKKLLLTSVAALFLATGTAHAAMCHEWMCGRLKIGACVVKHLHQKPDGTYGERTYDHQVSILREGLQNTRFRLRNLDFKFAPENWTASLNGKACKDYEEPSE